MVCIPKSTRAPETADPRLACRPKSADLDSEVYVPGFRYYSASLGRWVRRDPIGEKGGKNLFGFAANEVTDRVDPDGRWALPWFPGMPSCFDRCTLPNSRLRNCREIIACERRRGLGWMRWLPPCPCRARDVPLRWYRDFDRVADTYHTGATECYRSGSPYTSPAPMIQCCYDGSGKLITSGRSAGTPDIGGIPFGHVDRDVVSWRRCGWRLYNRYIRPPQNRLGCRSNPGPHTRAARGRDSRRRPPPRLPVLPSPPFVPLPPRI